MAQVHGLEFKVQSLMVGNRCYPKHQVLIAKLVILVVSVLLTGCGGSKATVSDPFGYSPFFVPAGVDSTVAILADSLSRESFVEYERELQGRTLSEQAVALVQESDSLWKILEMTREDGHVVSEDDSIQSIHSFNEAAVAYQEAAQLSGGDEETLLMRQAGLLDLAQEKFEEALSFNPFDEQTRALLGRVYLYQYNRLKRDGAIENSITVLERLVRLEKGRHDFFSELASAYYSQENWQEASINYQKAEMALIDTRETDVNAAEPGVLSEQDSLTLFNYAYYYGETSAFMYDTPTAMDALSRAKTFASGPAEIDIVDGVIEWIEWDGGNIRASELRDDLAFLEGENLQAAEDGYHDLMAMLQTQSAKNEITWKLALVEANLQKNESAVTRLKTLVDRLPPSAADEAEQEKFKQYMDAYGTLCYNLATENLRDKRDKRSALTYYIQSASIEWQNQSRAFLEAAKILQNNTPEAIKYAEQGLEANPTTQDKKSLYALLVSLHRRAGNQSEARRYFTMHKELQ